MANNKLIVFMTLFNNDNVLLLRRSNTNILDNTFALPGGHVEENESALTAVIREAHEELGIIVMPENIQLAQTVHRFFYPKDCSYICLIFVINHWQGEPFNKEPDKHGAVEWCSIHQLPASLGPYMRDFIACYPNQPLYCQTGWEHNSEQACFDKEFC